MNFSRSGDDDFVAGPLASRPGVISRYPHQVEQGGKINVGYTLGPGDQGQGPELSGIEGAIISEAPKHDAHNLWPRSKELLLVTLQNDDAGKKRSRRHPRKLQ